MAKSLPSSSPHQGTEPISPSPRYHLNPNGTLLIPSPSPGDAGTYFCTAASVAGFSSRQVQLSISSECPAPGPAPGKPSPEGGQPQAVVAPGFPVVFGLPEPRGGWVLGMGKTALRVVGCVERSCTSFVFSLHPAKPRISVNGSRGISAPVPILAVRGQEATLPCEAQGSPLPLVAWSRESRPLPLSSSRYRLCLLPGEHSWGYWGLDPALVL